MATRWTSKIAQPKPNPNLACLTVTLTNPPTYAPHPFHFNQYYPLLKNKPTNLKQIIQRERSAAFPWLQGHHNFQKVIYRSHVLALLSPVQLVFHSYLVRTADLLHMKFYFVRWFRITLGLRSSTSGHRNNTLRQTVVVLIIFPSDNFLACSHQVRAELQKSSSEESSPLQKQYSPTLNFIERKTFR